MQLFEGAKISKKLIDSAFADPDATLGFEAEFYIDGIGDYLKRVVTRNTSNDQDWVTRPLSKLAWYDLIWYFVPVETSPGDNRDNQEIIKDRLKSLYQKVFPDIETANKKYSEMFAELSGKYKPYHLLTLMKVFPGEGFAVDEDTNRIIRKTIGKGNIALITSAYGKLDDESFRMYHSVDADLQFNTRDDLVVREVAYEFIADALSDYLGEPVVATVDPYSVKGLTNGYQSWAITIDESLELDAMEMNTVGVELVSPVMQADKGKKALFAVMKMIRNFHNVVKGMTAHTSDRTGLHINIGVKDRAVDFVKLLFLMGDEYVAKNWNRLQYDDNPDAMFYAAQTYYTMVKTTADNSSDIVKILNRLESNISLSRQDIDVVHDLFRKNVPRDKYHSVNLKKLGHGFVEFRSPGNADYEKQTALLDTTVNQLVVMMHIATNPEIYRREFLKKLYRVALSVGREYLEREQQDINYPRAMQRIGHDTPSSIPQKRETAVVESKTQSFFHVTPTRNLPAIMKNGLNPRIGLRSIKIGEREPGIHMFMDWDQMEDAMLNWLGDEFEDEELSLLKISVPPNLVQDDPFYPGSIYIGRSTIPPSSIEVVETEL